MPQARYRHAAEIIGSELWLIGGRDVEDNLITDIDVSSPPPLRLM
jgi:hypothetical protein